MNQRECLIGFAGATAAMRAGVALMSNGLREEVEVDALPTDIEQGWRTLQRNIDAVVNLTGLLSQMASVYVAERIDSQSGKPN